MLYGMRLIVSVVLGFACALIPKVSFSQTPYYQGKTITILRGGEPGGSGDMQAKALIPFLKKYIAGNPTIVIENMPGAASMKAVNHAYSTAKPDGLTITAVGSGLASGVILGLPGVRYDIDKLIYVGSTEHGDPYVFLSRKEAGFDTLEKLRAASGVRVGAQTVGHAVYICGRIFSYLLGLPTAPIRSSAETPMPSPKAITTFTRPSRFRRVHSTRASAVFPTPTPWRKTIESDN